MSPLSVILFITFIDLVGFGIIIPLQATYAERLGASGLTFGLLVGIYAAMQFVFNPILGRWSDRVGRRRVLLLSIAGSGVSHALLGVADLWGSLPMLFVARTLDGITGANVATAQAYIADVTSPRNRARGMGLFGAAFGLGFVLGPATGAALAAIGRRVSGPALGTSWPAFGAAVVGVVALVLAWQFLPEPVRRTGSAGKVGGALALRALWTTPVGSRLRELLAIVFSSTFAFVLLEATFVYLVVRRFGIAETGTGLLFAYIGVLMIIVQGGLVGRLAPRFGEARLLGVAPFITALGFVLLATVPFWQNPTIAWASLIVGCVPTCLGHGLTGPNLNALISRHSAGDQQGVTLGMAQGIGSLARAIGPPVGGSLFDHGPSWPYGVGAVLFVYIGLFALRIRGAQEASITGSASVPDPSGHACRGGPETLC